MTAFSRSKMRKPLRAHILVKMACRQKITFGEIRDMGVHGVLIYCAGAPDFGSPVLLRH
jgi:hypothetical protein